MDTYALIRQSQEGDKAARNQVVTENVGLIWSIVRRFLGRGHEAEDLFQIGCIGLMKAVDKFELSLFMPISSAVSSVSSDKPVPMSIWDGDWTRKQQSLPPPLPWCLLLWCSPD